MGRPSCRLRAVEGSAAFALAFLAGGLGALAAFLALAAFIRGAFGFGTFAVFAGFLACASSIRFRPSRLPVTGDTI